MVCVGLWCLDEYWYYSLFTLLMLVMFESTVCYQRLQSMAFLREMLRPPYPVGNQKASESGDRERTCDTREEGRGDFFSGRSGRQNRLASFFFSHLCVRRESFRRYEPLLDLLNPMHHA
jgi:cation-transporting ATPase 13A1